MLMHLMNQVCLVIPRASATSDVYGDDVLTYDPDTGREFKCRFDPEVGHEYERDRDTRIVTFRLFLPKEASGFINALSHVIVDDLEYEVWGEPNTFRRRSQVDHVEAVCKRYEG